MTQRFEVELSVSGEVMDTCIMDIDQKVLDAVDDEWRSQFYHLTTDEQVAEMICYNMVFHRTTVNHMDGWADQSWNAVKIVKWPDMSLFDFTAKKVEL